MCVFLSPYPHIFGLQQILASFIAVGVRRHFWVDTGVVSAGQDSHVHTGVNSALQFMRNLSYLLMRACAKENLGNLLSAIFVLCTVFGRSTWAAGTGLKGLDGEKDTIAERLTA